MGRPTNDRFEYLLAEQDAVFTRVQAQRCGVSYSEIRASLTARRWQRVGDGILVAHSGPLDHDARLWSALLQAGPGALISHDSAAHLQGLLAEAPTVVHVTVAASRHPAARVGVVIHRTRNPMPQAAGRRPPQLSVESTVVDRAELAHRAHDVVALVVTAVSRRTTTPDRLAAALADRPRARWRDLLHDLLDDSDGVESVLEWRFWQDVERPHGLPRAVRQHEMVVRGARERRDVVFLEWRVVVELDGRLGHTGVGAFKDMRRDNAAAARGEVPLRYGWADVAGRPCEIAAQLAGVLQRQGWAGELRRCPRCPG